MAWLRIDNSQVSHYSYSCLMVSFPNYSWWQFLILGIWIGDTYIYIHIQGLCMGYVTGYTPKAFLVWYLQFRYLKWPLILVTTSRPSFRGWKTPLNSPTSYCLTHWILCACWSDTVLSCWDPNSDSSCRDSHLRHHPSLGMYGISIRSQNNRYGTIPSGSHANFT